MKTANYTLTEFAARLLDLDEREVVLGDLAESGTGALQGLADILGLFVRRQITLWKNWRPWLAAFGLALPGSFILMATSVSVCLSLQQLIGAGDKISSSMRDHVMLLLCQAPLLLAWSWTGGFVVGSLSRRTLWLSVALCASACLICLSSFRIASLSRLCLLVFLLPAIVGVYQGAGKKQIAPGFAILVAAAITVLMATLLSVRGWSTGLLVLLWPAWYMVATAQKLDAR